MRTRLVKQIKPFFSGDPEPPIIQRVFWAVTEGATATALLVAGGKQGLVIIKIVIKVFVLLLT